MRCPTLSELPPPPPGKTGWPWTEESPQLPDRSPWPRVSIVTPSYNQGQFIEGTIRSVLLQGYPDLEYIVIDGGSTDGSVEIICKYESWLAYWVSEPDRGQAHAINKGWKICQGEALTWLNSDDILRPGAMAEAAEALFADLSTDLVYGNVYHIDTVSQRISQRLGQVFALEYVLTHWHNVVPQPGFLMRRSVLGRIGELDADMRFAMDFDYWLRLAVSGGCLEYLPTFLAGARLHSWAKTSHLQSVAAQEQIRICDKIFSSTNLAQPVRAMESQACGAAYLSAAYWCYLAGNAAETRGYAARALRSRVKRRGLALALWLMSITGDRCMTRIRDLWRSRHRSIRALRNAPVGEEL